MALTYQRSLGQLENANQSKEEQMTFADWQQKYTCDYKGYTIQPGSILKDGEPVTLFYCGLVDSPEQIIENGKAIIDGMTEGNNGH